MLILCPQKMENVFLKQNETSVAWHFSHAIIHQCAKFGSNIIKHGMVQTTSFALKIHKYQVNILLVQYGKQFHAIEVSICL